MWSYKFQIIKASPLTDVSYLVRMYFTAEYRIVMHDADWGVLVSLLNWYCRVVYIQCMIFAIWKVLLLFFLHKHILFEVFNNYAAFICYIGNKYGIKFKVLSFTSVLIAVYTVRCKNTSWHCKEQNPLKKQNHICLFKNAKFAITPFAGPR